MNTYEHHRNLGLLMTTLLKSGFPVYPVDSRVVDRGRSGHEQAWMLHAATMNASALIASARTQAR